MKNPVLQLDNLDDRREVWVCLHRLPPEVRLDFLAEMCRLVTAMGRGVKPAPGMAAQVAYARRSDEADRLLTNEVWSNLWLLTSQYDLDPTRMVLALEAAARRVR